MDKTPLQRAIDACGGSANLAKRIGVTPQAVSQWRVVPPKRALKVAEVTGVSVEDLLNQSAA